MKKYTKKLLALAMVLAMVLSLGVSAYADVDTDGTYIQSATAPTITGTATVYLSVVSDRVYGTGNSYQQYTLYNEPITIGTSGITQTYYVSDVLNAAKASKGWTFYNSNDQAISTVSSYLYGLKPTSTSPIYKPLEYGWEDFIDGNVEVMEYLQYCCNGWMFRINNKIPLTAANTGATINQAYVENGDHVFVYFADTYEGYDWHLDDDETEVVATQYLMIDGLSSSGGTVTATIYTSSVITDINYGQWDLDYVDFEEFSGSIYVKIDNTTYYVPVVNGILSISNVSGLSAGTHTFEIVPFSELIHEFEGDYYGFNSYVGYSTWTV